MDVDAYFTNVFRSQIKLTWPNEISLQIQWGACGLVLAGNTVVFLTILGYFFVFGNDDFDYSMWWCKKITEFKKGINNTRHLHLKHLGKIFKNLMVQTCCLNDIGRQTNMRWTIWKSEPMRISNGYPSNISVIICTI